MAGSNLQSAYSLSGMYASILLLWDIWKSRCTLKFEGVAFSGDNIKRKVIATISYAVDKMSFPSMISAEQRNILAKFWLFPKINVKRSIAVFCMLANFQLTLHVDGASKGNPGSSGGGGCIRDRHGNMIVGFAFNYGEGSSILAEARALHDRLSLAVHGGLRVGAVYSDCALLVNSIRRKVAPNWVILPWWNRILELISRSGCVVQYTFREGNQVADALASYACFSTTNSIFTLVHDLPCIVKGAYRLDKGRLPNIRNCK